MNLVYEVVSNDCVKIVRIQSFSGTYFLVFGPNTEICSVNVRIKFE